MFPAYRAINRFARGLLDSCDYALPAAHMASVTLLKPQSKLPRERDGSILQLSALRSGSTCQISSRLVCSLLPTTLLDGFSLGTTLTNSHFDIAPVDIFH